MGDFRPASLLLAFFLTVALFLYLATVVSWLWMSWRLLTGQPLLPPTPLVVRGQSPWRWQTIVAVLLVYVGVSLFVTASYAVVTRVFPDLAANGPIAPEETRPPAVGPAPGTAIGPGVAAEAAPTRKAREISVFHMMVLNVVLQLALIAAVPAAVFATSRAQVRDFGLCVDGWEHQAATGFVATLIAAPVIYAIQGAASTIWKPSSHPLVTLFEDGLTPATGALGFVTAVVLAPMVEEAHVPWRAPELADGLVHEAIGAPPDDASSSHEIAAEGDAPVKVLDAEGEPSDPEPESTTLTVSSTDVASSSATAKGSWLAIILSRFFFAYVHAPQWPAPIALFVLACVIGFLFVRTGSLITAVTIHATFNGISTLMLFIAVLSGVKPGGSDSNKPPIGWIQPEQNQGVMPHGITSDGAGRRLPSVTPSTGVR